MEGAQGRGWEYLLGMPLWSRPHRSHTIFSIHEEVANIRFFDLSGLSQPKGSQLCWHSSKRSRTEHARMVAERAIRATERAIRAPPLPFRSTSFQHPPFAG